MDLVEVRKVIETVCAKLAAERATEEQICRLECIVEDMAEVTNDPAAYLAQDMGLHLRIAQASGNRIFPKMLELVREMFHRELRSTVYTDGAITKGFGYHRAVVHAIRMRDPDSAGKAMEKHLEDVRERLFDLVA
jgi:DNA-binding FadR family transcriptional regulator